MTLATGFVLLPAQRGTVTATALRAAIGLLTLALLGLASVIAA